MTMMKCMTMTAACDEHAALTFSLGQTPDCSREAGGLHLLHS